MNLREAAQQALEALLSRKYSPLGAIPQEDYEDAIVALRSALAAPDEIAAEREACAKICEEAAEYGEGAWLVANRIRARWCND